MKRYVGYLAAFLIVIGAFLGCAVQKSMMRNLQSEEGEEILHGTLSNQNSNMQESHNTEDYEKVFRERYSEINRLPLTDIDDGVTYYTINQGDLLFATSQHSVVCLNMAKNGFKVGTFFNEDPSLKTRKVRLLIRSGFSSVPDMTLEEQYEEIIVLLRLLTDIQEGVPSYEEFEASISLTQNLAKVKRYVYVPDNVKRFSIEENIRNGVVECRTLFCDIY